VLGTEKLVIVRIRVLLGFCSFRPRRRLEGVGGSGGPDRRFVYYNKYGTCETIFNFTDYVISRVS